MVAIAGRRVGGTSWFEHAASGPAGGTKAEVEARLDALVGELGLDAYAFVTWMPPRGGTAASPVAITSYPPAWILLYSVMRYDLVDPVLEAGIRAIRPFLWGGPAFLRGLREPQRKMMAEARGFGLGHGLAVPVGCHAGPSGMLVVAASDEGRLREGVAGAQERLFAEAWDAWEFMAATTRGPSAVPERAVALTPRERECLLWTGEGKTAQEVGMLLGLSVFTVNRHLSNATRKLGCANKHHAAFQALVMGIIFRAPRLLPEPDGTPGTD